eukprot:scaffold201055_cov29-Tisochrysis_lutea.AAC.23
MRSPSPGESGCLGESSPLRKAARAAVAARNAASVDPARRAIQRRISRQARRRCSPSGPRDGAARLVGKGPPLASGPLVLARADTSRPEPRQSPPACPSEMNRCISTIGASLTAATGAIALPGMPSGATVLSHRSNKRPDASVDPAATSNLVRTPQASGCGRLGAWPGTATVDDSGTAGGGHPAICSKTVRSSDMASCNTTGVAAVQGPGADAASAAAACLWREARAASANAMDALGCRRASTGAPSTRPRWTAHLYYAERGKRDLHHPQVAPLPQQPVAEEPRPTFAHASRAARPTPNGRENPDGPA